MSDDSAEPWLDEPEPMPPLVALAGRDVDQSHHQTHVSGDQYNEYVSIIEAGKTVAAVLKARRITPLTLAEQMRSYVATDQLETEVNSFSTGRQLLLLCPDDVAGSGQRSAAAYLVSRLNELRSADDALRFQELLPDDDEDLSAGLANAERAGVFIDAVEHGTGPAAADRLRQFGLLAEELADQDSYAVLAVSADLADEANKWFPGQVHRLVRPPGEQVFCRHATDIAPAILAQLVRDSWLESELRDAWPPDAAKLGQMATQAWRADRRDPVLMIAELKGARNQWINEARTDMRRHASAPERALLLTLALLEGAEPATILQARELLLKMSGYADPTHPLERSDILAEFERLADTKLDVSQTTFRRPEYGASLLDLAWREYPGLDVVLRTWIERLPAGLSGDTAVLLNVLPQRLAELSARQGSGRLAFQVAGRWTRIGGSMPRAAAVLLLREACLHQRIGHGTRQLAYTTAYYGERSATFRAVLAEAVGAFDAQHRSTAMTRLKHLARGPEPEVRVAVSRAVTQLTADLDLGQLLGYLTDWLNSADQGRSEVVVEVAATAMDRLEDRATPIDVPVSVTFWRVALKVLSNAQASALIRRWVRAGDTGIEVLLRAAGNDLRRNGQLLYAADNPYADGALLELLGRVHNRLNEIALLRTGAAREGER